MGVIWSFVRRSLAQNKTRTVVSIIGVVLSTALLMAVFTTITSLQRTIIDSVAETEGTWQVFDSDAEEGWLSAVEAEDRITTVLKVGDHCMANLATTDMPEEEGYGRQILAVRTLPQVIKGTDEDAFALTAQPKLTEGRLPENENELMIPQGLVGLHVDDSYDDVATWDGELAIGSTIQLSAGLRLTPSGRSVSSYYYIYSYLTDDDMATLDGEAEDTITSFYEERTFTVVGVFEDQYANISEAGGSNACMVAFTSANAGWTKEAVWLSTEGFLTRDELLATCDRIFGEGDYVEHNSLLNYEGLTSSSDIWRSVWAIVAVLAATIMIAAVSLIYNAFAISVAERTRQFGLLSSLGASRRQLGWAVILEALTIGAIGIPIGILLGVAGVAATLTVSSEALTGLLGTYGTAGSAIHVSPQATLIVIALSIVTLLISAVVPALRAGRVPATDAIRQTQDVHLDGATERKLKRANDQGKLLLASSSVREKLDGIGGLLAHRNLRRSGSKGRVVVASLAVSVLLLVTSGAIAQALNTITDRYEGALGTDSSDIVVYLYNTGEMKMGYVEAAEELDAKLSQIDGLEPQLTAIIGSAYMGLSSGMCSDEMIASRLGKGSREEWMGGIYADGSFIDWGNIQVVDDATWQDLLERTGAAESDADSDLSAMLINSYANYDDEGRYYELTPYDETGLATFYSFKDDEELFGERPMQSYTTLFKDNSGQVVIGLISTESGAPELVDSKPISDVEHEKTTVKVIGLIDEAPGDLMNMLYDFPLLVMPLSQFETAEQYISTGRVTLTYNVAEGTDMEEIGIAIDEACAQPPEGTYIIWQNMKENLETTRRIFDMVYLFVFLFSLITMLIAVANVFNTLSNNIILRTREFAVLKSCGMDNRDFARMLLSECASYAVRGLVIGLALATLAAWWIWNGMRASFVERPFELPWAYVAAAVIGVVVVLAISVVYALRRSHALNVVEALRADAI